MQYRIALYLAGCLLLLSVAANASETSSTGAPADWPIPVSDDRLNSFVLFDQLEYQNGADAIHWDIVSWVGGDYNRLWIESEGDHRTDEDGGEVDNLDILYGRLIAPFWDLQAGLGYQRLYGPGPDRDRFFAVVGIEGLAPYGFELNANIRASEDGDISADLEVEYDLLLTQRLVLQPRLETDLALREVKDFGVGQGLNTLSLGLRLRYEIRRELAPYIGIAWMRKLGDAADLARDEGEDSDNLSVVAGLRFWF